MAKVFQFVNTFSHQIVFGESVWKFVLIRTQSTFARLSGLVLKSMFPHRLDSVARAGSMKYKITKLHQVYVTSGVQEGNDIEINWWYVAGEGGP
jgi:hypothetical protein